MRKAGSLHYPSTLANLSPTVYTLILIGNQQDWFMIM